MITDEYTFVTICVVMNSGQARPQGEGQVVKRYVRLNTKKIKIILENHISDQ
jgi:hypothetical protein